MRTPISSRILTGAISVEAIAVKHIYPRRRPRRRSRRLRRAATRRVGCDAARRVRPPSSAARTRLARGAGIRAISSTHCVPRFTLTLTSSQISIVQPYPRRYLDSIKSRDLPGASSVTAHAIEHSAPPRGPCRRRRRSNLLCTVVSYARATPGRARGRARRVQWARPATGRGSRGVRPSMFQ